MPSIADLALLSHDVYDRTGAEYCRAGGWEPVGQLCWPGGFAGNMYQRRGEVVIAFRGTESDDRADILADLMMVPLTAKGAGVRTLEALLTEYRVSESSFLTAAAPQLLERILQFGPVRDAIRTHANSVPTAQVHKALSYFDSSREKPVAVTGHSLGGALAQVVAMERKVKAVAFNSPSMGDLRGTVPATFTNITQVNTKGDPLSLATRAAGNLSHGQVIEVSVPPPRVEPPVMARRSVSAGLALLSPFVAAGIAVKNEYDAQKRFHAALVDYLAEVMLYYHSIAVLRREVDRQSRFQTQL